MSEDREACLAGTTAGRLELWCSLPKDHSGNHKAYQAHDLQRELLLEWPQRIEVTVPAGGEEIVRVLRLVEYVGPRNVVEKQVENSIHGTRTNFGDFWTGRNDRKGLKITAVTLGTFPEVILGAREIADPKQIDEMVGTIEKLQVAHDKSLAREAELRELISALEKELSAAKSKIQDASDELDELVSQEVSQDNG